MRKYAKVVVKAGPLDLAVEMWSEHGHASVYNCEQGCIFDGYALEAIKARDAEVERLVGIARAYGFEPEVIK